MTLRDDLEAAMKETSAADERKKAADDRLRALQERLAAGETTGDALTDLSLVAYGPGHEYIGLLRTFEYRLVGLLGQPFLVVHRKVTYDRDEGCFDYGLIAPGQKREDWRLFAGIFSAASLAIDAAQGSWGFPTARWAERPCNKGTSFHEGAFFLSGKRCQHLYDLYLEPLVFFALERRDIGEASELGGCGRLEKLELVLGIEEVDKWCATGGELEYLGYAPEHRMSHLYGMFELLECPLTPALAAWVEKKRAAFAAKAFALRGEFEEVLDGFRDAKTRQEAEALGARRHEIAEESRRESERAASYGFHREAWNLRRVVGGEKIS